MSKKVVIISGSPRKGGNSDTLCEEFRKGCQEAGHQVSKISLNGAHHGRFAGIYRLPAGGQGPRKDLWSRGLAAGRYSGKSRDF